jgi:Spy/CpxP family protein refolding chaperone
MFLRRIISVLCLIPVLGVVVFAQETQTSTTTQNADLVQRREGFRRMKGQGRQRRGFGLGALNLTEEQKQQSQAILQRHLESTKAQREELMRLREKRMTETLTAEDGARAKELHQQLRDSMQGVRGELSGLLTPEQRTQFEQMENQRQERQQEMQKRRPGFRNGIPRQ